LTLAAYAAAKGLPVKFLRELGLSDFTYMGKPAVRIPYRDEQGEEAAVQFRIALEGEDRFKWRKGSRKQPYGLWRLREARAQQSISLVEGPSDTQTLWHHNVPALGMPDAGSWQPEWDAYLDPFATIYVVIEPDRGGQTVRDRISRSRHRDRVRLVSLTGAKDPSDLYLQSPATFRDRWGAAMRAAVPWITEDQQRRAQAAAEYFATAGELLHSPDVLKCVARTMRARGYAGALTVPVLIYVALTSRLLERPQNLAVIAPSSAGKNRAVDAAIELVPPEAVYIVSAASARALIYSDESFEHRTVMFGEADSIPEDGAAASAVRSIAADGCMRYDVVEKDPKTGRHATRRIEKLGPTGLITTSTRSVGPQLGTRVLEITVPDDRDQTRAVMRVHAEGVEPGDERPIDIKPLLDLQRWLASAGLRRVKVPFAHVLAERVPAEAVRMRRDFRQLLTTIQTIAFLRQCQRPRTADGCVWATIEDYAEARKLLASVFDAIAADNLTPTIRQTIEAVALGEEVSAAELGKRLGVSKATVSYRVGRALEGGWLVNHETRKGHAKRLARGADLPDQASVLPTVTELREVFEGSSRSGEDSTPLPPDQDPWLQDDGDSAGVF
jgi:hypothetical protein